MVALDCEGDVIGVDLAIDNRTSAEGAECRPHLLWDLLQRNREVALIFVVKRVSSHISRSGSGLSIYLDRDWKP